MIDNPQELIKDFVLAAKHGLEIDVAEHSIGHDLWRAPHRAKDLPAGHGAVYIFSLSSRQTTPAASNRVLKVGKVGPNSNPRFRYQHYKSGSANSTLAGALENNPLLWDYIGFKKSEFGDVGDWIRQYTDRDNFYIPEATKELIQLLEVYLKARLGPVFEGSLSSKA